MFETEAKGLALIRGTSALPVPEVVLTAHVDSYQFLLMNFIEEGAKSTAYWHSFGMGLAALHRNTAGFFGLDHDNYIGSLPQVNKQTTSWVEFFIERRLKDQLRIAVDNQRLGTAGLKIFENVFSKLPLLLPEEKPSLLHGDLWSGNVITHVDGNPCLIDPAVYYGHREADLAMTQLFGGFDPVYLRSYNEVFPLLPGYRDRFNLYNLYPLLVHVNLFGGGYAAQLLSILRKYE